MRVVGYEVRQIDAISRLENDFFSIQLEVWEVEPTVVRARASITRKDSGSLVPPPLVARAESEDLVISRLAEELRERILSLGEPETGHGNASASTILVRYLNFRNAATKIRFEVEQAISSGGAELEMVRTQLHDLQNLTRDATCELVRDLAKVPESEQLALLESEENTYDNAEDPWSLDDLTARQEIYKYLLEPSSVLEEAHRRHAARIESVFSEKR